MFVLRGRRVVLSDGERPASIWIDDGRIVSVRDFEMVDVGSKIVDAGDLVVSPGLVDSHVHVNEPGRTEWEGFETATRAAAAGGITTLVDMPLNSIPATVNVRSLEAKRSAARGRCHVDVAFWGGVVPGNAPDIQRLAEAGVRGFKCFLTPSGVDEFPAVAEADLRPALAALARVRTPSLPLLVHAEDPDRLKVPSGNPRAYRTFLAMRPAEAEASAIKFIAALCAEYHVASHIVHVSSAEGVAAVAAARAAGVDITAETCPHYLTFVAGDIPDGATVFKCAPPIRDAADREALWDALRSGTCGMVVTDHSPAPPALKQVVSGDFVGAWGGIASLELSLAAVWTEASNRGFGPADIARWMSHQPAIVSGLSDRKGAIGPGYDADLIVWDPDAQFVVKGANLQQRHKLTPYDGRALRGVVRTTYLAGVNVWDEGALVAASRGRLL